MLHPPQGRNPLDPRESERPCQTLDLAARSRDPHGRDPAARPRTELDR
jgi:hypothetical protein